MTTLSNQLISQSELARKLNVSYPRLARAIRSELISPDARTCGGRLVLFDEARLDEIRSLLDAVKLEHTIERLQNPISIEL